MKRSLSFFSLTEPTSAVRGLAIGGLAIAALAIGCAGPAGEGQEPQEAAPVVGTPVEPVPVPAPEPAVVAATEPPAPEPQEAPPEKPAAGLPGDLADVKERLEATKEGAAPLTLEGALASFPDFAASLADALAAGDGERIEEHLLSDAEIERVFIPSYVGIIRQGDKDWLVPIRERIEGVKIRQVRVVPGRHSSASMGASYQRDPMPSASGQIIVIDGEEGPIDLLVKQAFFVGGRWKAFRMEIAAPDERAP
ncbi:MAG: hypothetical protein JXP34_13380 [Planctomycetes bacterium]|nr:hypothetical protein [Planctomycetota bacterium]